MTVARLLPVLAAWVAFLPAPSQADDPAWAAVSLPTTGPASTVGTNTNGCIAGAVPLPAEGLGFQTIRLSRNRFWGHPELIDYLLELGEKVRSAGLPDMLVGDLGQPRGGPITGHASHETGLDVDIWLLQAHRSFSVEERERLRPYFVADDWGQSILPGTLTDAHRELIRLAASDGRVDRIFVHPTIKRELCSSAGNDREWLRRVRPWIGHNEHIHVRIACPPGSPDCMQQAPVPAGDGCGADLDQWFPMRPPEPSTEPPRPPPPLPAACLAILEAEPG